MTLTTMITLGRIDPSLRCPAHEPCPNIVDLELAGSGARASEIIATWEGANVIPLAVGSLLLDFPFLVLYSLTLAALCLAASRFAAATHPGFEPTGLVLAWGVYAAGLLDAVENMALLAVLGLEAAVPAPQIAAAAATVKFLLLGSAVIYTFAAGVLGLWGRATHRGKTG